MTWLIVIGLVLWAIFGSPATDLANWVWADEAAPWEQVDAFYYPDRNDLTIHEQVLGVGSVENCRTVVHAMAAARGDAAMEQGDYECCVGRSGMMGSIYIHRLSVR